MKNISLKEKRKDTGHWIKWSAIAAIVLVGIGVVLAFCRDSCINNFLFSGEKNFSRSDIITYFGVAAGGIILLGQLLATSRRIDLQDENNRIQAQGNLATRFKDASMLLGSENTSSILAGVYALHQVAVEADKSGQKGYVTVVKNILCAFLRENSERTTDEEGAITGLKRNKPDIVFQSVVDVLSKASNSYKCIDIQGTSLSDINFIGVDMKFSNISLVNMERSNLYGSDLRFSNIKFSNLSSADLRDANLVAAKLSFVTIAGANLSGANLSCVDLETVDFSKAIIDEETNFTGTIHEGKTIEEIKAYRP